MSDPVMRGIKLTMYGVNGTKSDGTPMEFKGNFPAVNPETYDDTKAKNIAYALDGVWAPSYDRIVKTVTYTMA